MRAAEILGTVAAVVDVEGIEALAGTQRVARAFLVVLFSGIRSEGLLVVVWVLRPNAKFSFGRSVSSNANVPALLLFLSACCGKHCCCHGRPDGTTQTSMR